MENILPAAAVLLALAVVVYALVRLKNRPHSTLLPERQSDQNYIFTTYFCNKLDPQRKTHAPCNDFTYIEPWYRSVEKLNLRGIVFHDGMSQDFINKFQTARIRFEWVDPSRFIYSLNDTRFLIYHDYLMSHPEIQNVFMTDGNDVTIVQDPFLAMHSNKVYVGSETGDMKNNRWFNRRVKFLNSGNHTYTFKLSRFRANKVYNAGILGGSYEICLEFLSEMVRKFKSLDVAQRELNLNMAVFNHTVYNGFLHRSVTGDPLHSEYKAYQNDRRDVWFIHK